MRFPDRIECRLAWMPAQGGHDHLKAAQVVQKVRKALGQTGYMNASEAANPGDRIRVPSGPTDQHEPRDRWDRVADIGDHWEARDMDEYLATGKSQFSSIDYNGFEAHHDDNRKTN